MDNPKTPKKVNKLRYFKIITNDHKPARFSGETPKDAALSAFISLCNKTEKVQSNNEPITLQKTTSDTGHKTYTIVGNKIALEPTISAELKEEEL